jgi:spermidine synthase
VKQAQQTGLVLAIFFVSGASGLIYEVAWFRLLSLSFGVSVYAASAVLTAFMGGLALGSWIFGKITAHWQQNKPSEQRSIAASLLRLFALIEIGVALFAFATPPLFAGLTSLYVWFAREARPDPFIFNAVRTALATLALVPPTFLMGGTLPVLAHLLAAHERDRGQRLGLLYAINTFGGVLGALAAGLLLIPSLGVNGALYLGGGLDLAVAGLSFWLAHYWQAERDVPAPVAPPAPSQPAPQSRRATRTTSARISGGRTIVRRISACALRTMAPFLGLGFNLL